MISPPCTRTTSARPSTRLDQPPCRYSTPWAAARSCAVAAHRRRAGPDLRSRWRCAPPRRRSSGPWGRRSRRRPTPGPGGQPTGQRRSGRGPSARAARASGRRWRGAGSAAPAVRRRRRTRPPDRRGGGGRESVTPRRRSTSSPPPARYRRVRAEVDVEAVRAPAAPCSPAEGRAALDDGHRQPGPGERGGARFVGKVGTPSDRSRAHKCSFRHTPCRAPCRMLTTLPCVSQRHFDFTRIVKGSI